MIFSGLFKLYHNLWGFQLWFHLSAGAWKQLAEELLDLACEAPGRWNNIEKRFEVKKPMHNIDYNIYIYTRAII